MKTKKIIALITSFVMLLGITSWAYADVNEEELISETQVEESTEDISCTDDSNGCIDEIGEELPEESGVSDFTEESIHEELLESIEDTESENEFGEESDEEIDGEIDAEESEDSEEVDEIEYDVDGFEMNGWWVPSIVYNDSEDTISFYLEDGTCFYTSPMAGLGHSSTWQGTGFWGYVEITYGGAGNLSAEDYSSYSSVLSSLS